jgi:sugar lactone lactonase YvrE
MPRAHTIRRMKRALLAFASLLVLLVSAGAQTPARDANDYLREATEAYKTKDYAAFLEATKHAHELAPDATRVWYNLACGYALAGDAERAAAWLDRLAAAGLVCAAADDPDFAAIARSPEFRGALARLASNTASVHHADVAFPIREKSFVPEGVAYDPVEKAFYVSSVHKRKVVRVDASGAATDFLAGRDDLWAAFGIAVDAKRRRLWVTTGAIPQMIGFEAADRGRSGALAFDLATGRRVKACLLPGSPSEHAISDLAVDSKGNVYVADSVTPAIYVIHEGTEALEPLVTGAPFLSPQGLAFSADERRLYVADYARGIFVVDPATRACTKLAHPDAVCLVGVDGLSFAAGALYATQNGISPKRVVRVALDRAGTRAERLDVLEANSPGLGEPTLCTVVDGWLYFVADSQWERFDEAGRLPPDAEMREHSVMRVRATAPR